VDDIWRNMNLSGFLGDV